MTLRGAEILKRADIVFYDALVHPDTLALAPKAKQVAVGKRCSRISTDQRFINRNRSRPRRSTRCSPLKGGDRCCSDARRKKSRRWQVRA